MSSHTSFHVYKGLSAYGKLAITTNVVSNPNNSIRTAYIQICQAGSTLVLHVDNLEDLEDIAFHLNTLARDAREAWSENTKETGA